MLYLLYSGDFIGQYKCDCFSICDEENHDYQTSDFFLSVYGLPVLYNTLE